MEVIEEMESYHAEIINLSLKDKKMIKEYPLLSVKKRFLGYVKIYTISIPKDNIERVINTFQSNMSTVLKKEWYITFHTAQNVIVVFRKKVFYLSGKGITPLYQKCIDTSHAEDKQEWDEMIEYAKTLGIPDEQCDFLPEDFNKRDY